MKHYAIHFQPDNLTAFVHQGATLLEAAEQVGIILATPCGGQGRCGKCKLLLLPAEKEVLACRYSVEHDLEVRVPQSSLYFRQKILEHGISHETVLDPSVKKVYVKGPFSGIDAVCRELAEALNEAVIAQDNTDHMVDPVQHTAAGAGLTAILVYGRTTALPPENQAWSLTGIEPGDTSGTWYGLAVDIGTTTVVARLVDLKTGSVKAIVSSGNPQLTYGSDVISRISYSEKDNGLQRLHDSIVSCLNKLIEEAAAGIRTGDICEVVAAGNTTMNHLFLKHPVRSLGQAPYRAYSLLEAHRTPADMKMQINPAGNIYAMANIAGFVGSDTVAAALACRLDADEEITLLVDIGTNGEIVLAANGRLTAASCAAGPALEGAGILFGSRAQLGAIERVVFDGENIDIDVIGGTKPSSICGSGLIDAVAVMLNAGIIDFTGRILEPDEINPIVSRSIRHRITCIDGNPAFILTAITAKQNSDRPIYLTQKDIRQVQLAKAAIHAGIMLLLKNTGIDTSAIAKLLLAGAFGNYIDRQNALRIGLLPKLPLERIHFVGNAAGTGAEMVLISRRARQKATELARQIEYLEIAHQKEFQTVFSDSLLFP